MSGCDVRSACDRTTLRCNCSSSPGRDSHIGEQSGSGTVHALAGVMCDLDGFVLPRLEPVDGDHTLPLYQVSFRLLTRAVLARMHVRDTFSAIAESD
jgi:hypothetical protein